MKRLKFSPTRRHDLAIRDGLAWWLWSRNGPMWVYLCPVCRRLIRTNELTVGHVVPLGEGGTNEDANLRVECYPCNLLENLSRTLRDHPEPEERVVKALSSDRRRRLKRRGRETVFSNIPVYWEDRLISFTSRRRAALFVKERRGLRESDGGVRLLKPPQNSEPARPTRVPNECVRCGVQAGLLRYPIYPRWHPLYNRVHPTEDARVVCVDCREVFEIAYAAEITQAGYPEILELWGKRKESLRKRAIALEAWSRRRAGLELAHGLYAAYSTLFGDDPSKLEVEELRVRADETGRELAQAENVAYQTVRESAFSIDFAGLFQSVACGNHCPLASELPRIPLDLAANS